MQGYGAVPADPEPGRVLLAAARAAHGVHVAGAVALATGGRYLEIFTDPLCGSRTTCVHVVTWFGALPETFSVPET
jgi:hypothetical protein